MASFSSKTKSQYKIRSISLPSRSHPSTDKIEVELNELKSCDTSSTPKAIAITSGLSRLEGLYICLRDLLNLQVTQQALSRHQQCEAHIDDLLEKYMSLLDICASSINIMSHMKETCRDIQSSLRRRKIGESSIESIFAKYYSFRKKMKKEATKLIEALRQITDSGIPICNEASNNHVSSVIRVLNEVVSLSVSIFHSLLSFFCAPIHGTKFTRWLMVSKILRENQLENSNELQKVDIVLDDLCKSELGDDHKMLVAQNCIKSLIVDVEQIENGVEYLYRELIRTRAYLLNIGSSML